MKYKHPGQIAFYAICATPVVAGVALLWGTPAAYVGSGVLLIIAAGIGDEMRQVEERQPA